MKLFNIFKKETSKEVKTTIQKMDKNQLSKVIGGGGRILQILLQQKAVVVKSKSNIKNN
jgi:hypothetical protein